MGRVLSVCAALHNVHVHCKVEEYYRNTPALASYENDRADIHVEAPQLRQLIKENRESLPQNS